MEYSLAKQLILFLSNPLGITLTKTSLGHDITFLVFFGVLGMSVLAVAIILFVLAYQKKFLGQQIEFQRLETQYQQDLLKSSIEAQERERKRIAQDLHDDIGALLSTVKLGFHLIKRQATPDSKQLNSIKSTGDTLNEAISHVRQISKNLLPPTLEKFGLSNALEQLCNKMQVPETLEIEFKETGEYLRLPFEKELGLYRVVQELMNNIVKHAEASNVIVELKSRHDKILLSIHDDGKGFDHESAKQNSKSGGLGLRNIDSRLSLIPAKLRYSKKIAKGSKAIIEVLLPNEKKWIVEVN